MGKENNDGEIDRAAALFKESQYAVAFTGAGISTESGIPDFRSPGSGIWENYDPMEVASIFGFRQNPRAFFDWIRPLAQLILEVEPNPAHLALARLEELGKLHTVVTQNIDLLHTRAGNSTIYELHGHMRGATCVHCFTKYRALPILAKFLEDDEIPHCEKCGGVLKPDAILFGEQLPIRELQGAKDAARKADLMLIVGSSLEVVPASDIPVLAHRTGARLIIVNLEPTPLDGIADVVIHGKASKILPAIVQRLEPLL